jgi:hypothetical protein
MNIREIVLNYLTDNEKGMQQLITWFLKDVMNEEVAQHAEYRDTRDRIQGEPIGMATGPDPSRPGMENSFSRNHNYERSV